MTYHHARSCAAGEEYNRQNGILIALTLKSAKIIDRWRDKWQTDDDSAKTCISCTSYWSTDGKSTTIYQEDLQSIHLMTTQILLKPTQFSPFFSRQFLRLIQGFGSFVSHLLVFITSFTEMITIMKMIMIMIITITIKMMIMIIVTITILIIIDVSCEIIWSKKYWYRQ